MGEVVGFVLAIGLYAGAYDMPNQQQRGEYMDGARASWDVGYVQSGLKKQVDKRLKDIEKKYVPKELLPYGSATAIVLKIVVQKQLSVTWSF